MQPVIAGLHDWQTTILILSTIQTDLTLEADGVETYPILEEYQKRALGGCHDDVGHTGRDRTLFLLRERFYWPSMAEYVAVYISQCNMSH